MKGGGIMAKGWIYLITYELDGKKYVGQTTRSVELRFKEHLHEESCIGKAMKKYKIENFTWKILEECATAEQLNEREKFWIAKYDCKFPKGYNMTDGGNGLFGLTVKSKLKISLALKKPSQYPILDAELERKGVSRAELARHIAMKKEVLSIKMHGNSRFTPSQMIAIRKFLGVSMPLEELFRKANGEYQPAIIWKFYPVLSELLQRQKITRLQLSRYVNLSNQQLGERLLGRINFSLKQAEAIKSLLEVEISLEELFRRADGVKPEFTLPPKPYVYPNLAAELKRQNITLTKLAEALNISEPNLSVKMFGKGNFSPKQKRAVKAFLGVDFSIEELFRRNDGFTPTPKIYAYPVLADELQRREITFEGLSKHLGLSHSSISQKINGKIGFTSTQQTAIKNFLGVDMPLDELFKKEDDKSVEKTPVEPIWKLYPVLSLELQKKNVRCYQFAKVLNVRESTISRKITGKRRFSLEQQEAIKNFLNVEMPLEELFKRAD